MRRYWTEAKIAELINIEGDEFHHIVEVCRQQVGSKFELLQNGTAYFVEVIAVKKKSLTAKCLEKRKLPTLSPPFIHLCVSLPKLPTFELILEKAVELGCFKLHPFVSDYSFVKDPNHERVRNKSERWQKIVKSATQQSGRGDLMELEPLVSLRRLIDQMNQTPRSVGLFAYEGESSQSVKAAILDMKRYNPEHIWIFVGSEGGFSQKEVEFFVNQKMQPSTLGDQILRVETACLSLVSIIKYEFSP
jgi:16S rRNA (uracil1498-N3)-methyltransferase